MTWFAVSDTFARDPRFVAAGPDTWPLFFAGEAYCAEQFTDGVIPKAVIPMLVPGWEPDRHFSAAAALAAHGIWEVARDGSAKSLEFLKHNQAAEARREGLAAQRDRMRRLRNGRSGRDGARAQPEGQNNYYGEESSSSSSLSRPARAPSPDRAAPVSRPPGRAALGRYPRPIAEEIQRQVSPAWRRPGA